MTPERKEAIKEAAERAEKARMVYQSSMMMNIPKDYEKRIAAAQNHALIRAEMIEAEAELRKLIGG